MGRRHICTGGDPDQSVLIRTPRTMPSRLGPRKPGHSASLVGAGGAACVNESFGTSGEAEADGDAAGAPTVEETVVAAGVAGAAGSLTVCASSLSSGLGAHRQPNFAL